MELYQEFQSDPALMHQISPPTWSGINDNTLRVFADWAFKEEGGAVRAKMTELAVTHESAVVRDYARLFLAVVNEEPNLIKNPSFEISTEEPLQAEDWSIGRSRQTMRPQ
jgi:hypothetical protein